MPYTRCDVAHNKCAAIFLKHNERMRQQGTPEKTYTHLLSLDNDHKHPPDIVQMFERAIVEDPNRLVIGGVNYRRSKPYDPCIYMIDEHEHIQTWIDWPDTPQETDLIGAASLCIAEEAFYKLPFPFFGYDYSTSKRRDWPNCNVLDLDSAPFPGVDIWFSKLCRKAGIKIWFDPRITSPHLTEQWITREVFEGFQQTFEFKWKYGTYYVQLEVMKKAIPWVFEAKKVLYVGASTGRHHYADELRQAGAEQIDLLEIYEPNLAYYDGKETFDRLIKGDVRDFVVSDDYDLAFWWHGPEHVELKDLSVALKNLEACAKDVVIGAPWGKTDNPPRDPNPYEPHLTAVYPKHLKEHGYEVSVGGFKDTFASNLMAWKRQQ